MHTTALLRCSPRTALCHGPSGQPQSYKGEALSSWGPGREVEGGSSCGRGTPESRQEAACLSAVCPGTCRHGCRGPRLRVTTSSWHCCWVQHHPNRTLSSKLGPPYWRTERASGNGGNVLTALAMRRCKENRHRALSSTARTCNSTRNSRSDQCGRGHTERNSSGNTETRNQYRKGASHKTNTQKAGTFCMQIMNQEKKKQRDFKTLEPTYPGR